MKLSSVAKIVKGDLHGSDNAFTKVSIDTRTLARGELFFALKGQNFDAHHYLDDAKQAGAAGVIVSQDVALDLPWVKVVDVHQALFDLARYHRQKMHCTVIAVTGSCGKTTTRALLESVFQLAGKTLASQKSFNNDIGVPLTLLRIKPEHQYVICELGANHPGEIAKLVHLVKPDIAIITNAASAHLEGFGDLQGVACAKGEIFQGLSKDGVAVINQDDQFAQFWQRLLGHHQVLTFAMEQPADVQANNIVLNQLSQPRFNLILNKVNPAPVPVQLQLIGQHNVYNALAVVAAGYALHIPIDIIKKGLESCVAVNKRLVAKKGFAGAMIIDDSYNANPMSVTAAMHVLKNRDGDSILVLGDMLELGENTLNLHHAMGAAALELGIDRLFCYGKLTRATAEAFGKNAYFFESQDELISALKKTLHQNMNVLIKGSLSTNMGYVVSALMEE